MIIIRTLWLCLQIVLALDARVKTMRGDTIFYHGESGTTCEDLKDFLWDSHGYMKHHTRLIQENKECMRNDLVFEDSVISLVYDEVEFIFCDVGNKSFSRVVSATPLTVKEIKEALGVRISSNFYTEEGTLLNNEDFVSTENLFSMAKGFQEIRVEIVRNKKAEIITLNVPSKMKIQILKGFLQRKWNILFDDYISIFSNGEKVDYDKEISSFGDFNFKAVVEIPDVKFRLRICRKTEELGTDVDSQNTEYLYFDLPGDLIIGELKPVISEKTGFAEEAILIELSDSGKYSSGRISGISNDAPISILNRPFADFVDISVTIEEPEKVKLPILRKNGIILYHDETCGLLKYKAEGSVKDLFNHLKTPPCISNLDRLFLGLDEMSKDTLLQDHLGRIFRKIPETTVSLKVYSISGSFYELHVWPSFEVSHLKELIGLVDPEAPSADYMKLEYNGKEISESTIKSHEIISGSVVYCRKRKVSSLQKFMSQTIFFFSSRGLFVSQVDNEHTGNDFVAEIRKAGFEVSQLYSGTDLVNLSQQMTGMESVLRENPEPFLSIKIRHEEVDTEVKVYKDFKVGDLKKFLFLSKTCEKPPSLQVLAILNGDSLNDSNTLEDSSVDNGTVLVLSFVEPPKVYDEDGNEVFTVRDIEIDASDLAVGGLKLVDEVLDEILPEVETADPGTAITTDEELNSDTNDNDGADSSSKEDLSELTETQASQLVSSLYDAFMNATDEEKCKLNIKSGLSDEEIKALSKESAAKLIHGQDLMIWLNEHMAEELDLLNFVAFAKSGIREKFLDYLVSKKLKHKVWTESSGCIIFLEKKQKYSVPDSFTALTVTKETIEEFCRQNSGQTIKQVFIFWIFIVAINVF